MDEPLVFMEIFRNVLPVHCIFIWILAGWEHIAVSGALAILLSAKAWDVTKNLIAKAYPKALALHMYSCKLKPATHLQESGGHALERSRAEQPIPSAPTLLTQLPERHHHILD